MSCQKSVTRSTFRMPRGKKRDRLLWREQSHPKLSEGSQKFIPERGWDYNDGENGSENWFSRSIQVGAFIEILLAVFRDEAQKHCQRVRKRILFRLRARFEVNWADIYSALYQTIQLSTLSAGASIKASASGSTAFQVPAGLTVSQILGGSRVASITRGADATPHLGVLTGLPISKENRRAVVDVAEQVIENLEVPEFVTDEGISDWLNELQKQMDEMQSEIDSMVGKTIQEVTGDTTFFDDFIHFLTGEYDPTSRKVTYSDFAAGPADDLVNNASCCRSAFVAFALGCREGMRLIMENAFSTTDTAKRVQIPKEKSRQNSTPKS